MAQLPADQVLRILKEASHELRDVDVGHSVERVAMRDLTPMRFARDYVARNKPVIIEGALDDWPALALWRSEYLAQVTGGLQVSVAITPGGRADAITHVPLPSQPLPSQQLPSDKHRHRRASPATSDCGGSRRGASGAVTAGSGQGGDGDNGGGDGYGGAQQAQRWFLTPHTQRMSLAQFFALARHSRAQGSSYAPYVQHQNSNLTEEFSILLADLGPAPLAWAAEVFGGPPDASNMWVGDERSVTSFHKDHYENMYAVLQGTKVFTLLPPCDVYRMALRRAPAGQWVPSDPHAASPALAVAGVEVPVLQPQLLQPPHDVLWSTIDSTNKPSEAAAAAAGPLAAAAAVIAEAHGLVAMDAEESLYWSRDLPAPLVAHVRRGELLYLPAMWHHHVAQFPDAFTPQPAGAPHALPAGHVQAGEGGGGKGKEEFVIAVNFWYDMVFDARYTAYRTAEALAQALHLNDTPPPVPGAASEGGGEAEKVEL